MRALGLNCHRQKNLRYECFTRSQIFSAQADCPFCSAGVAQDVTDIRIATHRRQWGVLQCPIKMREKHRPLSSLVLRLKSLNEFVLDRFGGSRVVGMIVRSSVLLGCGKAARNL